MQEADVGSEGFDLGEIVRGDEDGGVLDSSAGSRSAFIRSFIRSRRASMSLSRTRGSRPEKVRP